MPKPHPVDGSDAPATPEPRGQIRKAQSAPASPELADAIEQTVRLWRKHHLTYDQTKYVVEQARRRLTLSPPRERKRTIERLDWSEVQRLIDAAYALRSTYGLLVKTLFYTGARVDEFIHIQTEDLHLEDNPPQIHLTQAKRQSTRYVPIPSSLAHELRTHLGQRKSGFLFESNRHTRYAPRTVQDIVQQAAVAAGIGKRVYPHLLRHSIATLLLQSGEVPLDQVQKFLGHRQIGTTQVYAETSLLALGENYQRALRSLPGSR
jgi:integrase/recombinase XerD